MITNSFCDDCGSSDVYIQSVKSNSENETFSKVCRKCGHRVIYVAHEVKEEQEEETTSENILRTCPDCGTKFVNYSGEISCPNQHCSESGKPWNKI